MDDVRAAAPAASGAAVIERSEGTGPTLAGIGEITVLLGQARGGDDAAWDRVVHLLYADLKRLARRASAGAAGQEVTALVHDCYLRLDRSGADHIESRAHFLSLASMVMRQLLINHARDHLAQKRGGDQAHTTLGKADLDIAQAVYCEAEELLAIDAALKRLGETDARLVRVVECRLFGGLSEEETATALALPLRSTQRLWQRARARLRALADETG
ncbi:ECF-type sigma factor [Lysobacter sp. cf310]|uniref:ECF-type sigma factor n=1 Tax=Lysobacter sp. cf310 TaxID=1761790 RepID=UPI000A8F5BDB|nr:ECF-type sigma factor [Lysobacter sp. cf310]